MADPNNEYTSDQECCEAPKPLIPLDLQCHVICFTRNGTPRAAVLKGPIDQIDEVFRLDVTHLNDKI